jgi:hypothetical protein
MEICLKKPTTLNQIVKSNKFFSKFLLIDNSDHFLFYNFYISTHLLCNVLILSQLMFIIARFFSVKFIYFSFGDDIGYSKNKILFDIFLI